MNLCLSVAGILHNETPHGASQSFMMDNSMGLSPAQLDPFYTQGYIYISIWIDGWKGGKKMYVDISCSFQGNWICSYFNFLFWLEKCWQLMMP